MHHCYRTRHTHLCAALLNCNYKNVMRMFSVWNQKKITLLSLGMKISHSD